MRESIARKIDMAFQIHHGKVEFYIDYRKPGTAYEQLEDELHRLVEKEVQRRLANAPAAELASNHC